jgi:hypothetical protein
MRTLPHLEDGARPGTGGPDPPRARGGRGLLTAPPVDHLVTSATFSLDGGTWDVDNSVWFVGDERRSSFQGGPGATGRSYSNFDTVIESIRGRLLTLPGDTGMRTGHGGSMTIGAEAPHLEEWISSGQ